MLIGLSGYARHGKDSVGDVLGLHGFRRLSFADKLRESLLALDPYLVANAGSSPTGIYLRGVYGAKKLSDLLKEYGSYEGIKESPYSEEWRRLQQREGTQVGRNLYGEDFWVDLSMEDYFPGEHVVVTDCRFPNEYEAVKKRGGLMWRIVRPGYGPATDKDGNVHTSETSLDGYHFDLVIDNDGSLEDLQEKVLGFVQTKKSA